MTAKETLERYYAEMRWRCLSLAADMDRVERAGTDAADPRLKRLRDAIHTLTDGKGSRAERVQMIFSDMTPPPER